MNESDLEAMANAMLSEDAKQEGKKMSDYRREYGLIQRREIEEISFEPDLLVTLTDKGKAKKIL